MQRTTVPPRPEMEGFLAALLEAVRSVFGERLVSVVLYGSVARGDQNEDGSDLDLLIVAEGLPAGSWERHLRFRAVEEALRPVLDNLAGRGCLVQFSPVLKTPAEASYRSPLYLDMVHDARLLFDREAFFARVLAGLRARLDELGARRVRLEDGSWYWDLKPDYRWPEEVEI